MEISIQDKLPKKLDAKVLGGDFAKDRHFYLKAIIKDGDREIPSLIRLKSRNELLEEYRAEHPYYSERRVGFKSYRDYMKQDRLDLQVLSLLKERNKGGSDELKTFAEDAKNIKTNALVIRSAVIDLVPSYSNFYRFTLNDFSNNIDHSDVYVISATNVRLVDGISKQAESIKSKISRLFK